MVSRSETAAGIIASCGPDLRLPTGSACSDEFRLLGRCRVPISLRAPPRRVYWLELGRRRVQRTPLQAMGWSGRHLRGRCRTRRMRVASSISGSYAPGLFAAERTCLPWRAVKAPRRGSRKTGPRCLPSRAGSTSSGHLGRPPTAAARSLLGQSAAFGGGMLLKIALVLLAAWFPGVLGVYSVGGLVDVLLLVGLMLLLLAFLRTRDAAMRRPIDGSDKP